MPKLFYGFILVTAAFLIQMVAWGIYNSYGIFFNPLIAEFGWSRATISGAVSVSQILIGFGAIIMGNLNDRFGPRVLMTSCGIFAGLGYLLMSQVNTVWQLYVFYGIIVGIGVSATDVVLLSTIARWFIKRRGMMSGILKMGTGAGIMIAPLILAWLVSTYQWRTSFIIIGVALIVCVVLGSQFLRRDPAQMHLFPDGKEQTPAANRHFAEEGLSLEEATHTRRFWMLCLAYLTIYLCTGTMLVHIVPHVVDLGHSAPSGAAVLAVIGGASIAGRLVMGMTGDKIGSKKALITCFVILIAAYSWLLFSRALWMLILFALVYGFSHGGFYAIISPIVAEFFGTRSHGLILGIVIFCGSIGGAIGPLMVGAIFDETRSYLTAWELLLSLVVVGLILILSSGRIEKRAS